MADFNTFNDAAIRELRRDHARLRHLVQNLTKKVAGQKFGTAGPILHCTADSEIDASADGGLTPGIGTVTMRVETTDGTGLREVSTWQEEARNHNSSAITAGVHLYAARDSWGRIIIIGEDCGG